MFLLRNLENVQIGCSKSHNSARKAAISKAFCLSGSEEAKYLSKFETRGSWLASSLEFRQSNLEAEAYCKANGTSRLVAVWLTVPAAANGSGCVNQLLHVVSRLIRLICCGSVVEP